MPLPPLPTLSPEHTVDDEALWLYLGRLRDGLDNFTPSQVAAALDLGALGSGPGSPLNGVTLPMSPPVPTTPVMNPPVGFYRQIVISWDIDVNPFIAGWEVQRATDLAFTANVTTLTSAYALMFVDNDRADSTTYYYRVRALTADPANFSPYSAPQGATTLANDSGVLAALQDAVVLIQRAHIHNLVVDTAMIADASILGAKIALATITAANIALATITNALIANATITGAKIANATITDALINNVSADKLIAGTISVLVSLTNNTIKLDGINNVLTITDTQGSPVVRVKIGKLGAAATDYGIQIFSSTGAVMWDSGAQGATQFGIKDLEVISAKLNDLAVLTGKINNNAVTAVAATAIVGAGYTNSSTTYTDVVSVTLTTTGAPVQVSVGGNILIEQTGGALKKCTVAYQLLRDSTSLRELGYAVTLGAAGAAGGGDSTILPTPLTYLDPAPSAGSHTYKLRMKVLTTTTTVSGDTFDIGCLEVKK